MAVFDHMSDERRRQLIGVLLLFVGLLIAVSLGTHVYFTRSGNLGPDVWTSRLGVQNRQIANWMFDLLGIGAWVIPMLLVMWGWNRIRGAAAERLALRSVFLTAVAMTVIALVALVGGGRASSASGIVGAFIADAGTRHIGKVGTFLAGLGVLVAVTLLTTEFDIDVLVAPFLAIGRGLSRLGAWAAAAVTGALKGDGREGRARAKPKPASAAARVPKIAAAADRVVAAPAPRAEEREERGPDPAPRPAPRKTPAIVESARPQRPAPPRPRPAPSGDFRLPPLSLLDDPPDTARAQVSR